MGDALSLLAVVIGIGLAATAAAVAIAVLVLRRLLIAARETADRAVTRARSYGVGPASEVARLRVRLADEVSALRSVVATARAEDWPLGDAPSLTARLEAAAAALDGHLRAAAREPDAAVRRRVARELAPRVDQLAASARGVREGLCAGALAVDAAGWSAVAADCGIEAHALRAH